MKAAFYKATRPGLPGVFNRLGRRLNNGPYSHTELVIGDISWSSSYEDGCVRGKRIRYRPERWDFIEVPKVYEAGVLEWFAMHAGLPYDVWGNIRFFFGLARESTGAWFCSEANMASLGMSRPWAYGPNDMAAWMLDNIRSNFWAVPFPTEEESAMLRDPRYAVLKER